MNTRGQVVFFGIMVAIVIIVLALALSGPIKETVDSARNSSQGDTLGMDCSNSSISDFQKGACMTTDISIFYFIGGLIFIAGAIVTAKVIMQ